MEPARARAGWEPAFRAVFESSRNGIAILDHERRVVDMNDALIDLLGYTRDELIGRALRELVPPDETEPADRALERLREQGAGTGHRSLRHADGRLVNVQYAGRLVELPGLGEVVVYVAIDARVLGEADTATATSAEANLTPRENEVVRLVALGYTGDEIAGQLHLSPETVRSHVRNAMGKTASRTRAQLVATALERQLITI
jgi:PAS domain S-box-containing protein